MSEITLRQLEYLSAVAETGSVSLAAERCRVTQAAVSVALAQLETSVGASLLIRQRGRGVALTAEGREVASRARTVMADVADISASVTSMRGKLSGRLIVAVYRTLSSHVVPGLIDVFADRYPDVEVQILEGSGPEVHDLLFSGRAALGVLYRAQVDGGLAATVVQESRRRAVFSPEHPLAAAPDITLAALADHPAILLDEEPALQRTLAAFTAQGLKANVAWRSGSIPTIHNVVGRNRAYGILMQTTHVSPEGRPLVFRELEGEAFANPMVAALAHGVAPTALVRTAIGVLREELAIAQSRWSDG